MANTHCKGCIFAVLDQIIENSCEFDIPKYIKDIKEISIKDKYLYISNYRCKYAFSENILTENQMDKDSIKYTLIEKSHIQYYLVVDARNLSSTEDFIKLAKDINNLDISPKLVSILITINDTNNREIYKQIYEAIDSKIKWKLHAFLNSLNFNEAGHIAAETNIQTSESSLIYFWDYSLSNQTSTNKRLNHVFFVRNIQQNNAYGFESSGFDGLCIPISLYKSVTTLVNKNIIEGLSYAGISLSKYDE